MRPTLPLAARLLPALVAFSFLPHVSAISVWINEIDYDNPGTDNTEFVELAGIAGSNLANYSLLFYNGAGGTVYRAVNFTAADILPNQANGFGTLAIDLPTNGIQNGPADGIALVHSGSVLQFLSYEGSLIATGGAASGLSSIDIGVSETNGDAATHSLQLRGNGSSYADFSWFAAEGLSKGGINTGQRFESVPDSSSILSLGAISLLGLMSFRRIHSRHSR